MNPLFLAYVASLAVPPLVFLVNRFLLRSSLGTFRCLLCSGFVIFLLLSGTALVYDKWLHQELARFDLDGDQIFSGPEVTPEQERALFRVTNDVSRTFAPVLGALYGTTYSAVFFGLVALVAKKRPAAP